MMIFVAAASCLAAVMLPLICPYAASLGCPEVFLSILGWRWIDLIIGACLLRLWENWYYAQASVEEPRCQREVPASPILRDAVTPPLPSCASNGSVFLLQDSPSGSRPEEHAHGKETGPFTLCGPYNPLAEQKFVVKSNELSPSLENGPGRGEPWTAVTTCNPNLPPWNPNIDELIRRLRAKGPIRVYEWGKRLCPSFDDHFDEMRAEDERMFGGRQFHPRGDAETPRSHRAKFQTQEPDDFDDSPSDFSDEEETDVDDHGDYTPRYPPRGSFWTSARSVSPTRLELGSRYDAPTRTSILREQLAKAKVQRGRGGRKPAK